MQHLTRWDTRGRVRQVASEEQSVALAQRNDLGRGLNQTRREALASLERAE